MNESKKSIFNMILGLGFQFHPLVIELRYDYNVTDAYVDEEGDISGKLGTFTIMAGLIVAF